MTATIGTVRFRQGAGRLCLDFIRTLRYRRSVDATEELAALADLADWVAQCGPCDAVSHAMPPSADIADARDLREAIYELIEAARGPGGIGSCGRTATELINRMAAHPIPTPSLAPPGGLHWHADDPVTATLALIARDALDLATSPEIHRVHECASPTCGALFSDSSRPGTRRWCSMEICGNRAKKETLRSRAMQS
jgi:predicted RNA-binding Zn ribbon-like protein